MRTWLLEGGLSALLFLALLPVAAAPLLGHVYRRFGYAAPMPTTLSLLTGLYACALLSFTTFPLPEDPEARCVETADIDYWQLQLGSSLGDMADAFAASGASALTSGVVLQVAFNIVFFVPLGLLVAFWWKRGPLTALAVGFGTSLLIELSQGTALWGIYPCPYRLADVDDLVTNTSGALLGWALGAVLSRMVPYRTPERRADPGPPTVRRRLAAVIIDLTVVVVAQGLAGAVAIAALRAAGAQVPQTWLRILAVVVGALAVGLVPVLRRDGASPGQVTLLLVTTTSSGDPAARLRLLARFALRWLGPLVLGGPFLLVVLLVEGVGVLTTRERLSTTSTLLGLRTRTREQWSQPGAEGTRATVDAER